MLDAYFHTEVHTTTTKYNKKIIQKRMHLEWMPTEKWKQYSQQETLNNIRKKQNNENE